MRHINAIGIIKGYSKYLVLTAVITTCFEFIIPFEKPANFIFGCGMTYTKNQSQHEF